MLTNNLSDILANEDFSLRHIGPSPQDQLQMLQQMGYSDMDRFIDEVVPESIRERSPLAISAGISEQQALSQLRALADQNQVNKSYIGLGYYDCHTPHVILRNVLENPAWYTAYTPYQPEISQGRLEALLNFQTMVTDLTGMSIANASLLDEGTAAAEAMALCQRMAKSKGPVFFVDENCLPQTIAVIQTRAEPVGIEVVVADPATISDYACFGVLLQYPGADGVVGDFSAVIELAHQQKALVVMAADLLALTLIQSPGELGADVAIGTTQRFGVPMGFGGPHAGYMAIQEKYKRSIPGRLVGISQDTRGEPAYRLALQTREQHIRREKATSNICTAQVLLAVMASMYAVYHGPQGLKQIAQRVHRLTAVLREGVAALGFGSNASFFDTLTIQTGDQTEAIYQQALAQGINLGRAGSCSDSCLDGNALQISLDETTSIDDVAQLLNLMGGSELQIDALDKTAQAGIADSQLRTTAYLTHPVFNSHHSETEMLRYLRKLSDKDIALDRAMIPLGSCTMKLNATAEMIPVSWPEFSQLHPFVPQDQATGYLQMIHEVEQMLCAATGYAAVSLQPNAGSQGEYAGLLAIRAWHKSRGDDHRNICLIPGSAHGTNPASAQMCGMKVVVVKCDEQGNVDVDDLREKAEQHSNDLAAIMITYPSTHGVFEERIGEVCDIVHQYGGQVYMDGANLNAMVGLCQPGKFGGDVSHLNLHKTFCIPHGGGGPGVGPVAVAAHLVPYLPGLQNEEHSSPVGPVSAASWGSASILPITWMYIKMMGAEKLRLATEVAILNANYIATRLKDAYPILYSGQNGRVAHECIIDLNPLKVSAGVTVDDVAKRLIDFGFHAPTMSFPVAGTLMIEPTESESLEELDRFCDAMLQIREEIALVEQGQWPEGDNPLHNAPHTADMIGADEWSHSYSREKAAYPLASLKHDKYWPPVGRIDNVYGDRNLMCSCLPMEAYEE